MPSLELEGYNFFLKGFLFFTVISNSELTISGLPAATSPTLELLPKWKAVPSVTSGCL